MAALNGPTDHQKRVGYRFIIPVLFLGVLALGLVVYYVVRHEELRSLVTQLFVYWIVVYYFAESDV